MNPSLLQHYLDKHKFRVQMDDAGQPTGHVFTGPVRISFPKLDPAKPKPNKQGKNQWGALLIVPSASDVSPLFQEIMRIGSARFGAARMQSANGAGNLKIAMKPSEKLRAKYKGFEDSKVYLDTSSNFEVPILDSKGVGLAYSPDQIYAGVWALARVRVYTYPKPGVTGQTEGVGIGLVSLKKIADDDKLSEGDSTSGFDDVAVHPSAMNGAAPASAPAAGDLASFLNG